MTDPVGADHRHPWPSKVAQLIEENVAGFLLEMGTAGGGTTRHDQLVVWTAGGSPIGYHNAVVACAARGPDAGRVVEEWLAELARLRLPGCWHWTPAMNADLPGLLVAGGLADVGEEPAMAADLATLPPTPDVPDGFRIAKVQDQSALDDYRSVLADGFGEGPMEAEWVAETYSRIGLDDGVAWRHYVGLLDAEPASAATLYLTEEAGGLYFVATRPVFRRRGLGAAISHHAMAEAASLGKTMAVLGSSPMGMGIYRSLGFQEVFRYRLFEWEPVGGSR